MVRLLPKFAFIVLSTAVCFGSAESFAGTTTGKVIFKKAEPSRSGKFKTRTEARRGGKKQFFWFLEGDRNDDVAYYDDEASSSRSASYQDFGDPEPYPTIGMGNLPYEPVPTIAVFDKAIVLPLGQEPVTYAIAKTLADRATKIRALRDDRAAVIEHYKSSGFKPLWIADGKLTDRAKAVLTTLASAEDDALDPAAYMPLGITEYFKAEQELAEAGSPEALARFDIGLSVAVLKYARHLASGQFEPARLSQYNDIKIEAPQPANLLKVLAFSPFPSEFLASQAPKHVQYSLFKSELKKLRADRTEPAVAPFPEGKKLVKIGQKDVRIPELRARMLKLGHLQPADALVTEADGQTLDKPLSQAIKLFQEQNGIKPNGLLDLKLVKALNADKTQDQINKLAINMERVRWLPKSLGDRYVFANQASYQAKVVENGKTIWQTKIIVGRPLTQTAAFHDRFETVVFNPTWGIPQSILVNEYLPKLRKNPGYFDKIGYWVTNERGQRVRSSSVEWWAYGNQIPYGVQQPPGAENALGEVKFLFPNSHAIYMHDTPNRELFAENVRNFSHGCVRVENPREFASVLLGWDRDRIASEIERGDSHTTPVTKTTDVHLTYFTAWPDENGNIQYYSDAYERDATMLNAMTEQATAQKMLLAARITTSKNDGSTILQD